MLIEDAAEALGAEYKGKPIGSHGPSAVFGFYPNKQITTGEGGVIVTHSEEELRQLVSLRNQGRSYAGGGWFHHVQVGFNYRWTDIQAAIGVGQLEKLDRILSLRREAADRYTDLLAGLDAVQPLTPDDADHRRSWFVYVVQLASGIDRDDVMAALRADGIATAEYVPCVHLQPYMRELYGFSEGLCPVAEDASRRTLALPFHTRIHEADQQRVVDALERTVIDVRSLGSIEPFVTKDGSLIKELCGIPPGGTTNVSLAEATLERGQVTTCHYHRESEEIYFVLEGQGDGARWTACAGRAWRRSSDLAEGVTRLRTPGWRLCAFSAPVRRRTVTRTRFSPDGCGLG